MNIQDRLYTPVKKRGIGNTLRMGQACIPCRLVVASGYSEGLDGTVAEPSCDQGEKKRE